MITTLSLCQHVQISLQVSGLFPSSTVNAGQHGPTYITTPIRTSCLHQLEGLGINFLGVAHVGTTAQVGELTLIVNGNSGILRKSINQLQLVGLVSKHSLCFRSRKLLPLEILVAGKNLSHFFFDSGQIFLCDGAGQLKIIVKTVLNGRPNGHLGTGK